MGMRPHQSWSGRVHHAEAVIARWIKPVPRFGEAKMGRPASVEKAENLLSQLRRLIKEGRELPT
jgi:hypothetical protein